MQTKRQFQVFACRKILLVMHLMIPIHSYRFGHISRTLRALQSSTKTSLRIDKEGLLSFQLLMPSPKPKGGGGDTADAFIEFRVSIVLLLHVDFRGDNKSLP